MDPTIPPCIKIVIPAVSIIMGIIIIIVCVMLGNLYIAKVHEPGNRCVMNTSIQEELLLINTQLAEIQETLKK